MCYHQPWLPIAEIQKRKAVHVSSVYSGMWDLETDTVKWSLFRGGLNSQVSHIVPISKVVLKKGSTVL